MNNKNYYSSDIIEQVISANDLMDIVSQYVTLKKMGTSLKACCPFHTEKTPSFVVSTDKQLYHCFGCGVGGNVITFIMEMEKLNFVEALHLLADRAKITLPKNDKGNNQISQKRERQFLLHKDAAIFYYRNLLKNEYPQKYLKDRGIEKATIKKFGIGYANYDGKALFRYLLNKKYTTDELLESGLVLKGKNPNSNEYYDRFRDRIMFPILSVTEKVIGFGGRVIDKEKYPKYLNSPETSIFTKGRHLYGLNNAKKSIVDNRLILVEGYMDVIGLYQKGVKNAVASLGTAFTTDQGKLLKRYTGEVVVVYDGDRAGQEAASKAIEILEKCDINPKVAILPSGLDPDEYISKYGKEEFTNRLNESLVVIEYKIAKLKQKYNTNSIDGRINFAKEMASYLSQLEDSIVVEAYLNKISVDTGISKEAIAQEMQKNYTKKHKNNHDGKYRNEKQQSIVKNANQLAQERLLTALASKGGYFSTIKSNLQLEDFESGIYRKLAEYLFEKLENNEAIEESLFIANIEGSWDINTVSSIFASVEPKITEEEIYSYINTIKKYRINHDIQKLQGQLTDEKSDEEKNEIYYEIIERKRKLENL